MMGDKKDELKNLLEQHREEFRDTMDRILQLPDKIEGLFQKYLGQTDAEKENRLTAKAEEEQQEKIKSLEETCRTLQETLTAKENELKRYEESLHDWQENFNELMTYWRMYEELSDSTKDGLKNVVRADNPVLFLVSCTAESSIQSIWSYLRDIVADPERQEDASRLSDIFDYSFRIFNSAGYRPKYERDSVESGQPLDDQYHSRTADSAVSGPIQKVYLQGYRTINTKRIVGKSLVKA